jgi:hypothetical protein
MSIFTRLSVFGVPIFRRRSAPSGITIVRPSTPSLELYVSPYYIVKSGGIPAYNKGSVMPSVWMRKCGGMDYDCERKMFKKNINELYTKFGVPMIYYVTSYDVTANRIFCEDTNRYYVRRFEFKARFGLATEESLWNKWARYGVDNFPIWVSKDHYRSMSTYGHNLVKGNIGKGTYDPIVPQVGDIIESKYNKYLYEITSRNENDVQFHLSKHYVWTLNITPFTANQLSMSADTSASMPDIIKYDNIADIFGISADLSTKVGNINFDGSQDVVLPKEPNGGW